MNSIKYFFLICFVLVMHFIWGQENTVGIDVQELENHAYEGLSLAEWKKFKRFEKKLELNKPNQERQLRAYARDSLQILGVKLLAVKVLHEKKLLDRDIAENNTYYVGLLKELHDSAIPRAEYLFLEEKLALVNQVAMQKTLSQSRWLNLGLLLLSVILGVLAFRFRTKSVPPPVLSRQEITVRNLILQGRSNKEIANELFISLSTVKSHITNIYGKLNISSRQELLQKSTGTST